MMLLTQKNNRQKILKVKLSTSRQSEDSFLNARLVAEKRMRNISRKVECRAPLVVAGLLQTELKNLV